MEPFASAAEQARDEQADDPGDVVPSGVRMSSMRLEDIQNWT